MRTLNLSIFLLLAAVAQCQNYSYVTMGNPVVTSGSIPSSCGYAYPFQLTASAPWTLYCPGFVSIRGGTTNGTGNGACPTGFGIFSPCAAPNGSPAPTFASGIPTLVGSTWSMPMNIGNAFSSPVIEGVPIGYVCTAASATTALSTTDNVTCPPPPCNPTKPGCGVSPIVIDPTGEGFFLTSKQQGVEFREEASIPQIQMSWTNPTHHNGWLVRPNADGSVTSLSDNLFGNLSPQPSSDTPNGYSALAYWAEQEGCGTVERLAACPVVWQQLRLWHDANQDGIAQPDELSTLDASGVRDISLKYHASGHVDQYGNVFRYAASIYDDAGEKNSRSYDVFLIVK